MPRPSNKPTKSTPLKKSKKHSDKPDENVVDFKTIKNDELVMTEGYKKEKLIIGDYSIGQDELYAIGDAELDDKGLVHHHISSANVYIHLIRRFDRPLAGQRTGINNNFLVLQA